MSDTTELDDLANAFGGDPIAEHDAAEPRFPFVLVIDTSASTSTPGPDGVPDIDNINSAVATIYQKLRSPQPGDPLELTHHQVDLALIAYSFEPRLVQAWTAAPDLPISPPLLTPEGGTATGAALLSALDICLARQVRYKKDGLPRCGLPHIFHLTDGGANDVKIGSRAWHLIEARLKELAPKAQDRRGMLWHFVAPGGFAPTGSGAVDAQGRPISGAALLSQWFGQDSIVPLEQGADGFETMADLIVKTITAVSQQAAGHQELMATMQVRRLGDGA
ncbi:MAG: hypothetical protein R3D33_18570 [Hyphomicrobiaceae bacterium]